MTAEDIGLKALNGAPMALTQVDMTGQVQGLLLHMRVRQRYCNQTGQTLETVYTFPLPWGATLLGLQLEHGSQRLQGTVVEKTAAEARYEAALEDGDLPLLVAQSAPGLYSAQLGQLKDGDEVWIELEYAQLLRLEQGQVRLCIPTVLAPRHGEPGASLSRHETAAVDPLAAYPLRLDLDIAGPLAQAQVTCPSHAIHTRASAQGLALGLARAGWLDRDFVLNLGGLAAASLAQSTRDGAHTLVLASFCPRLAAPAHRPLAMKILVDCSGSMQGDSMASARHALHQVLAELDAQDRVSYSVFGDQVRHRLPALRACTPATVHTLSRAITQTEADMGGTELNAALLATFQDITPAADTGVLLITDGALWDAAAVVQAGRASGQRVFAIGVGSAPAESLLRELSESSGGACELVAPNEDMAAAIVRMFHRMRGARAEQLQVDWGAPALWQSALPQQLYDGETLHVFAQLAHTPTSAPCLHWQAEGQAGRCQAELAAPAPEPAAHGQTHGQTHAQHAASSAAQAAAAAAPPQGPSTLARLGAARRLAEQDAAPQALALALAYQLISAHTHMLLVHVRAPEQRAQGLPELQQIEHMQAAGHSGFGSVLQDTPSPAYIKAQAPVDYASLPIPSVWRIARSDIDSIRLQRKDTPEAASDAAPDWLALYDEAVAHSLDFDEALDWLLPRLQGQEWSAWLDEARALGLSPSQAWALLLEALRQARAIVATPATPPLLSRRALRLLQQTLATLDPKRQAAQLVQLQQHWETQAAPPKPLS